jgi:acyl-CoA thioester hydrolase
MKIRVYYEDTDCGNVVYYANYLRYMERGRTEFMREAGIGLAELRREGIQFAVIDLSVKYRAPAHYDDLLDVETVVKGISSLTASFQTSIRNESGILLVVGEVRLACIAAGGKARRIPRNVAEQLLLLRGGQ